MTYLTTGEPADPAEYYSSVSCDFLPIPGKPGYAITETGIVHNTETGHVLRAFVQKSSTRYYLHVHIGRVHRLLKSAMERRVLTAEELVCHIDGNAFRNGPDNLKIGSAKQNAIDKIASNTNGRKLNNAAVREIRRLVPQRTRGQLARQFGVTENHIGNIIRGAAWANLV